MDFRRRDRVVTGQNVAGENRQGKRLIAGAVKIAASELIVFIERMIDLPDEAVHVIQRSGCDKDVRPARVVKQRQRSIGAGHGLRASNLAMTGLLGPPSAAISR